LNFFSSRAKGCVTRWPAAVRFHQAATTHEGQPAVRSPDCPKRPAIETLNTSTDRLASLLFLCLISSAVLDQASSVHATTLELPPHLSTPPPKSADESATEQETVSSFDKTRPISDSATEALKHNDLGVAFVFRGDREQAVDEFKHALRLEPNYFAAYLNLANTLLDMGKHEEAVAQFHEALRLKPADAKAHNDLGVALKSMGDVRAAVAEFQTVLSLRPDDVHAHNNLGVALKALGNMDGAIAEYRTAIRLQPSDLNAHYNLGLVMMESGNLEAAVAEFRTALHLRPNDGGIRFNLGTALAGLGKRAEAAHEFQQYLRLELDTPANRRWIEQAEAKLRELESQ
jgi:Flp pilus assembly protein TadD